MKTEKEIEIKLKIIDQTFLTPDLYNEFADRLQEMLEAESSKQGVSIYSEPYKVLETSYYDTQTMDLRKSKIAYRVRIDEETKVATIKTDMPKSGNPSEIIARRLEQTVTVPENTDPDNFVEIFKETEVLDVLKHVIRRKSLTLLFTTKFDRKSYLIEKKEKFKILMCIDSGTIICGDKKTDIHEIELELIEGEVVNIFDVAYAISAIIPVNAETMSKYARGLMLTGKVPEKEINRLNQIKKYNIPDGSNTLESDAKMPASHAIRNLIFYKFAVENHQSDYEAVHSYRVFLRHLFSITGLAKSTIQQKDYKKIRKLIKSSIKKSSGTRETDILLHSWKEFSKTLDNNSYKGEKNFANKISAIITAHRQFERAGLEISMSDGKFTSLQLLIEKWVHDTSVINSNVDSDEDNINIGNTESKCIPAFNNDALSDFIIERDVLISELSGEFKLIKPKKLHKIRLAVKDKRYILKYFNVGLSSDELRTENDKLKFKQDLLGELNDIVINLDYCEKILPECDLTDKFRKWLKEKQVSLYESLEPVTEIPYVK